MSAIAFVPLAATRGLECVRPGLGPVQPARPPLVLRAGTDRWAARRVSTQCSASSSTSTSKCIRCGELFNPAENHANACNFHGDIVGNTIDYNLYEDHHFDDPSLNDRPGPRFAHRWGCCQEKESDAVPCKLGWHITYDTPSQDRSKDITLRFKNG